MSLRGVVGTRTRRSALAEHDGLIGRRGGAPRASGVEEFGERALWDRREISGAREGVLEGFGERSAQLAADAAARRRTASDVEHGEDQEPGRVLGAQATDGVFGGQQRTRLGVFAEEQEQDAAEVEVERERSGQERPDAGREEFGVGVAVAEVSQEPRCGRLIAEGAIEVERRVFVASEVGGDHGCIVVEIRRVPRFTRPFGGALDG